MEEKKDQRKFVFFKRCYLKNREIFTGNLTSNSFSVKDYIEHQAHTNVLTKELISLIFQASNLCVNCGFQQ